MDVATWTLALFSQACVQATSRLHSPVSSFRLQSTRLVQAPWVDWTTFGFCMVRQALQGSSSPYVRRQSPYVLACFVLISYCFVLLLGCFVSGAACPSWQQMASSLAAPDPSLQTQDRMPHAPCAQCPSSTQQQDIIVLQWTLVLCPRDQSTLRPPRAQNPRAPDYPCGCKPMKPLCRLSPECAFHLGQPGP